MNSVCAKVLLRKKLGMPNSQRYTFLVKKVCQKA